MASLDLGLVNFFGSDTDDEDSGDSGCTASKLRGGGKGKCSKGGKRSAHHTRSEGCTGGDGDQACWGDRRPGTGLHNSKSCGSLLPSSLPPEKEEGNVEYKLKLVRPTPSRLEHLVTQLKWRLAEGQGQAVYELGVEDNGVVLGLSKQELNESLRTLESMCQRLSASYIVLRERQVAGGTRKAQEILIRRLPNDNIDLVESRLAVLGNLDAGKSTLLGVLTQGDLDNGHGRARLNLFRHPHEIQTGYTSSVSSEILGFDARGNLVNYSGNRCVEDILEESSKLYRLIDLAGHVRYQKTTLRGLTAHDPHLVMLVVSSVTGLTDMAQEHAALAIGLQVPFIVVINKIDVCDHRKVLASVECWLKSAGNKRVPLVVLRKDDAITAADNMLQGGCGTDRVTPVFPLSCVTGAGLDLLKVFLNVLPAPSRLGSQHQHQQQNQQEEFCVDSVTCLDRAGRHFVLSGPVLRGLLREGDLMQLGPGVDGVFVPVRVTGLNRNRLPCGAVQAGHWASVTVALQLGGRSWGTHAMDCVVDSFARRGAFLVSLNCHPPAVMTFTAEVDLHLHSSAAASAPAPGSEVLRPGQRLSALCGSVCQQVRVQQQLSRKRIQPQRVTCGGSVSVMLRFDKQAELVRPGDRLVLRCGHRVVGVGRVMRAVNLTRVDER